MVSFVLSFFPRDVLDEILDLTEFVHVGFPTYFFNFQCKECQVYFYYLSERDPTFRQENLKI